MSRWHPYTKWWLLWGAAFLAIETSAVLHRRKLDGGSLSSLIWRFLDTGHPVRRAVGITFIVGLASHFIFKWPDI